MKRCLISLIIREMQIKIPMRYHLSPVRTAIIKKSIYHICWKKCGEKGTLLHCWWQCKLIQPLWSTVWRFLKKLGIKLPYDPAILLLGIYPEETKLERDTCITLFTEALFIIVRTWKQPRCPMTNEWIKKLWYLYTMEYYSAIKRNAFESVLMRWVNLEHIIQCEVSQKEKDKHRICTYIWNLEKWYWRIYLQDNSGEIHIEKRFMDMGRGEGRVRCMKRVKWKLTLPYVK